jgi:hypothetical protein
MPAARGDCRRAASQASAGQAARDHLDYASPANQALLEFTPLTGTP